MFTGCVKRCTFLFIDVIVGWFVFIFVLCFRFCFQMFKCIKKGYYELEFFKVVGNRDILTKELSQICLFFGASIQRPFMSTYYVTVPSLVYYRPFLKWTLFESPLFFKQGMFCLGMFCTGIF